MTQRASIALRVSTIAMHERQIVAAAEQMVWGEDRAPSPLYDERLWGRPDRAALLAVMETHARALRGMRQRDA